MSQAFRVAFWGFAVLYGIALFLLLIGTLGWFGQAKDPLAGVFLLPLGMPWVQVLDMLSGSAPWTPVLAPLINMFLIRVLGQYFGRST